jgi:hypothetical protein
MSSSSVLSQLAPRAASGAGAAVIVNTDAGFAASARVWLVLVGFLALVQLFITHVGGGLERDPRSALFAWPSIVGFGLAGLVGVWFSHRTGFPAAWTGDRVSNLKRIIIPALVGMTFGLLATAIDLALHGTRYFVQQTGNPSFNVPFPGSLLFYPGGAIVVEVIYRLVAIPVLLWLVSNVVLRGRAQSHVFWLLAVLTSLVEPLDQNTFAVQAGAIGLAAAQSLSDFGHNFAQAAIFRHYGFLAAILTRVAMYMVWHVVYGNFICQC